MEETELNTYEFDIFKQENHIVHGVFTRTGGTSKGKYDSLNIGLNSGDDLAAVAENRKRIIRKMGMKPFVFLNQVHGADVKILKKNKNDLSQKFQPGFETYTADGIITDISDLFLVIQVADCQAVMLYDAKKKVIANIHSGWRGSVKNIIGRSLDKMKEEFGCRSENILAGICPSLGPCCSEFVNFKKEIPKKLWPYKIDGKNYFDFWKLSKDQLMEKGVQENKIENMEICTKCHTDIFYSFRAQKTTGRFACVIAMQ